MWTLQRIARRVCGAPRNLVLPLALLLSAQAATRKQYPAEGIVVDIDRNAGTVVISHRPIEGFMPAMSMPFTADPPAQLDALEPGMRVAFDFVVAGTKARRIRVTSNAAQDFKVPQAANKLSPGAEVPDVDGLLDQHGHPVRFSEFRGKVIALQFIYTRCPLPEVCPRQAAQFAYLNRRQLPDTVFLTFTLDPTYDTPEQLHEYAKRWQAAGPQETWRFVTSRDEDKIRQAGGLFGVVYWPEEGAITHTSSTAIIGRDGRLKVVLQGSSHRLEQIADLIAAHSR